MIISKVSHLINLRGAFSYFFLACAVLSLVACAGGGVVLHHDFQDYDEVYAHSLDQQLLYNLARASQDAPPSFIQLGQITDQHTMTATAGLTTSSSELGKAPGLTTLGSNLGGTVVEQPTFQMVPLNGTTFSQALSTPIDEKLLITLYDQGFPADELMRVMVQSIQLNKAGSKEPGEVLVNDPDDESYPKFLAYCYNLRLAQTNHLFNVLEGLGGQNMPLSAPAVSDIPSIQQNNYAITTPTPSNPKAEQPVNITIPATGATPPTTITTSSATITTPSATITTPPITTPASKDDSTSKAVYQVSWPVIGLQYNAVSMEQIKREKPLLVQALSLLHNYIFNEKRGFGNAYASHQEFVFSNSGNDTAKPGDPGSPDRRSPVRCIKMRTFLTVIQAVSHEEQKIREHEGQCTYTDKGLTFNVTPIIKITPYADLGANSYKELISLNYAGSDYSVGDVVDNEGGRYTQDENGVWKSVKSLTDNQGSGNTFYLRSSNRRAFGLISVLYADIGIDPKQLPVQQLIQVQ